MTDREEYLIEQDSKEEAYHSVNMLGYVLLALLVIAGACGGGAMWLLLKSAGAMG